MSKNYFVVVARDFGVFVCAVILSVLFLIWIRTYNVEISMKDYLENVYHDVPEVIVNGQYEKLEYEDVLGMDGFFVVVGDHDIIYNSSETDVLLTFEELKWIPDESNRPIVTKEVFEEFSSEVYTELTFEYYESLEKTYQSVLVYNEYYEVEYTNLPIHLEALTPDTISLLQGRYGEKYAVSKLLYETDGKVYGIIFFRLYNPLNAISMSFDEYFGKSLQILMMVFILLAIMYLIILYLRVKKPLNLLEKSIEELSKGKRDKVIYYTGPKEFELVTTAFNDMSAKLRKSEEEKAELENDKRQFMSSISHDLKTPMTIMKGYLNAIIDNRIDVPTDKYLRQINVQLNKTSELLEAFEDFNNLGDSSFRLNLEAIDLSEFLRQYFIDLYDEIELQGYKLDISIPERAIQLDIDRFQMKRVLDNIVYNSMRHTSKGTLISFEMLDDEDMVHFYIGDDGPGLPPSIQNDVFKPLVMGDTSRVNKHGQGLGMSIVERLIKAHDGSIDVMKNPKKSMNLMYHIKLPKSNVKKS